MSIPALVNIITAIIGSIMRMITEKATSLSSLRKDQRLYKKIGLIFKDRFP